MSTFEEYKRPILPTGSGLTVAYITFIAFVSVFAASKVPKNIFLPVLVLFIPMIVFPFSKNAEFAEEFFDNDFVRIDYGDGNFVKFIKRFFGGYYTAIAFPFLKFKSYLFPNKIEPDLKEFTSANIINYYIVPAFAFALLISAVGVAIYFNENVINSANSVGIYYLDPSQRKLYQFIFTLLLITIIFSLIPDKMAKAINGVWHYYMVMLVCTVNLVVLADQLNRSDSQNKGILMSIFVITLLLLLYSLYNLIYLSPDSKDYRILILGKLNDEDRININAQLYGVYDAVQLIANNKTDYFDKDGNYFDADKAVKRGFEAAKPLLEQLDKAPIETFRNQLKRLDRNFISLYTAKASWEKNLKSFFRAETTDRVKIIDGYFSSDVFNDITQTDVPYINQAAKDFRNDWYRTRSSNVLPNANIIQKLFSSVATTIGGNVVLGAVSSSILQDLDLNIDKEVQILFNRYMLVVLLKEFSNLYKFFKNFEIYKPEGVENVEAEEENEIILGDYKDLKERIDKLITLFPRDGNKKAVEDIVKLLNIYSDYNYDDQFETEYNSLSDSYNKDNKLDTTIQSIENYINDTSELTDSLIDFDNNPVNLENVLPDILEEYKNLLKSVEDNLNQLKVFYQGKGGSDLTPKIETLEKKFDELKDKYELTFGYLNNDTIALTLTQKFADPKFRSGAMNILRLTYQNLPTEISDIIDEILVYIENNNNKNYYIINVSDKTLDEYNSLLLKLKSFIGKKLKELRPAGNGLINQFVNNTEVVNKIIPFFEIVSSGDLEAVPEEEFVYQWSEDTPQDKLRIKAEVISKYKKYFEEIKIKQNEKYISLTSKQKNKIASSDRFKEIYKYYFKKSVPKSGEAIDSLFEKFNSIFKAYTIAIRSYLISSNPTERELTKDITLRLKNEIFLINEGFPENIVKKFDVYSREELYKKIEIGRFEAAENFEIYNLKVKRTSDLANTTADIQKMTRELTQKAVEDKMKIDDEKTSIFAIIIGTLKKGGTSTETIKTKDGKPIVQIRFLDTKTLWDNKNNIAQKTFNVMVKLLLSTLVYLKDIILNIRLDEYNGFNNRLQYGPFITALISTLFVGSYTDLSAGVAKGIDRGTVAGYISTESGVSSTIKNVDNIFRNNADDENSSDKNVKDFFDGLKGNIDLNITNYTTDVKDIFKVSLSVINTKLADIAQNIVDNSTIKPPNANDKLRGIINRNIDNISYPMIAKILERKDVISNDNLDAIFVRGIDLKTIANALSENIEQGTEDLLISMLEKDYKENIKNSNDPLQTLRETIVNNPFVNCLGIIE